MMKYFFAGLKELVLKNAPLLLLIVLFIIQSVRMDSLREREKRLGEQLAAQQAVSKAMILQNQQLVHQADSLRAAAEKVISDYEATRPDPTVERRVREGLNQLAL